MFPGPFSAFAALSALSRSSSDRRSRPQGFPTSALARIASPNGDVVRASPSHAPPRFPGRHVMMHASLRVKVLLKDLSCLRHRAHIDSQLLPAASRYGARWSIHHRHLGSASYEAPPTRFFIPPAVLECTVPGGLSPAAGVARNHHICLRVTPAAICYFAPVHEVASASPPLDPHHAIKPLSAHPPPVLAQLCYVVWRPYVVASLHRPEGRLTCLC